MVKYGGSVGTTLSTTLFEDVAVVSTPTLLVAKLLNGPPPPTNPSKGSCPSLSPHEPAGQRKGLSNNRLTLQTPPSYRSSTTRWIQPR
jgi:hypothetical protein